MKFVEVFTLNVRGPVSQAEDVEVEGTLLVAEKGVANWTCERSDHGCDDVALFPAYHNGERGFLLRRTWNSGPGYSAYGVQDYLISLEEGIKRACEHGQWRIFDGWFPKPAVRTDGDLEAISTLIDGHSAD